MADYKCDSWVCAQTLAKGSTLTAKPSIYPPKTPIEVLQTELGTSWIVEMLPGAQITVTAGAIVVMKMPPIIGPCVFKKKVKNV